MATIGEIAVNLIARTSGMESGFKRGQKALAGFRASAMSAARTLTNLIGIGGGFAGLGFATKLAAEAEASSVAIQNMTKSLEVTKKLIADINQFSTVTPFEPTELRDAAQKLLAFNFSTTEIMPTLKTLGDVAAGSGGRLEDFVNILGKVRDRGKVTAETLNEFGIRSASVMDALAGQMGVARSEVVKLARDGKISFNDLVGALKTMTSEGGLFAGAMEKQSKTLAGRWSTLTGNVKLLGEQIGMVLLPAIGKLVNLGNAVLGWLVSMDQQTIQLALATAGSVAAMVALGKIIPMIVGAFQTLNATLRATILSQTMLTALAGPAAWVKIGAALAATAATAYGFYQILGNISTETNSVAQAMERTADATEEATKKLVTYSKLRNTVNNQAAASQQRRDELNRLHGTPITSRSLMPGNGQTQSVVDEIQQSNEYLRGIEENTRSGGVEINEVDL